MGFLGIEEIFLQVGDLEKAVDFYHNRLGIQLGRRDEERVYLQLEKAHVVLQIANHGGRHQGGGPLHFCFTVTEDTFDTVTAASPIRNFERAAPWSAKPPERGERSSSSIPTATRSR